jgi:hypothetical protein
MSRHHRIAHARNPRRYDVHRVGRTQPHAKALYFFEESVDDCKLRHAAGVAEALQYRSRFGSPERSFYMDVFVCVDYNCPLK